MTSSKPIVCALLGITIVLIAHAAFRPAVTESSRDKLRGVELTEIIARGKNKTTAYEKPLTPNHTKGLAAFIRDLAKEN